MANKVTTLLPAVVAGTAVTQVFAEIPAYGESDYAVGRVSLVSPSAVANPGTVNYATVTVRYFRGGTAQGNLAQLSLSGVALTAETTTDVPLVVGRNQSVLQSGDVIDVQVTHTGTGQALPAGVVVEVEFS